MLSRPITIGTLAIAGFLVAGSSAAGPTVALPEGKSPNTIDAPRQSVVGLVASIPRVRPVPRAVLDQSLPSDQPEAARPHLVDVSAPLAAVQGIPEVALAAYRNAEMRLAESTPGCGVTWNLLAGIGKIESNHANGGSTDTLGTTLTQINGPTLDGSLPGNEIILDAAGGHTNAVGPMQFLPSTWQAYAQDGNADGTSDPNNIYDAALAAGTYLCSGGLNLRDHQQEVRAILRYNNSMEYVANVTRWAATYGSGRPVSEPVQATGPTVAEPSPVPTVENVELDPTVVATTVPSEPVATPAEPMILIPGLPPIPCGILCPPAPPNP